MNFLSVENISKSFGDKVLFRDVSFGISRGDKTALIALNGAGKTTLLRLLVGLDEPDSGNITFAEGIRVAYLQQQFDYDLNLSLSEFINSEHNKVQKLIAEYNNLVDRHQQMELADYQLQLEKLSQRMDAYHAWDYERRLTEMMNRFGLTNLDQKLSELSGGQLKRLSLAIVLVEELDLIILDEPTNHLDVDMIEWLEKYLSRQNCTLLMVTHDRYFLDRICNNILELSFEKMYQHKGNFSYYLEKSAEREEILRAEAHNAGQMLKQELVWMRRMPQARTTKSKSRIAAFYELKEKASVRRDPQQIELKIEMNRIGNKILEMRNVSKSFGDFPIIKNFDYTFNRGERIGIIGENGVGKTSFLNLLTGQLKPDGGRVLPGDTIVFGYYTQAGIQFSDDKKIIDVVKEIAEYVPLGNGKTATASQMLNKFMFPPSMQNQQVSLLSGGEKRRLYLLTVLVSNPNFLILDEPTNDLDLLTLQALEEFIQNYQGCLLIVSHDRYFMDQVVDQLFVFEGDGEVKGFMGNYSEYKEMMELKERERITVSNSDKPKAKIREQKAQAEKTKRSFKEQKEYEEIEDKMTQLEEEKEEKLQLLQDSSTDFIMMEEAGNRMKEIDSELDKLMNRWIELDEYEEY